jgi:hypothetical protein
MMQNDKLDTAIDQVAASMVNAPDNPELMMRIVSALPERRSRFGWLVPQLAAIGAIVLAAIVWTTRSNTESPMAPLPSVTVPGMNRLASTVAAHDPGIAVRAAAREPMERLMRMEPTIPVASDFDRSLPAIAVASSLAVADARTSDIAEPAAIGLASIEIADLKLTAESFPTQKEE